MGRHEFIFSGYQKIRRKYCDEEAKVLRSRRRADGRFPPCPDAPEEDPNISSVVSM
jgi:hypothetical protein